MLDSCASEHRFQKWGFRHRYLRRNYYSSVTEKAMMTAPKPDILLALYH